MRLYFSDVDPFKIFLFFFIFTISCDRSSSDDIICDMICENTFILDDVNCECIDYREQYIGQWEFTKYWSISHPYNPSEGVENWIGEITLGDSNNTLFIPFSAVPPVDGNNYIYYYEFEINLSGQINQDTYDANDFNYFFEGYINSDSLYYSTASGSPFSSNQKTVYGIKIN